MEWRCGKGRSKMVADEGRKLRTVTPLAGAQTAFVHVRLVLNVEHRDIHAIARQGSQIVDDVFGVSLETDREGLGLGETGSVGAFGSLFERAAGFQSCRRRLQREFNE